MLAFRDLGVAAEVGAGKAWEETRRNIGRGAGRNEEGASLPARSRARASFSSMLRLRSSRRAFRGLRVRFSSDVLVLGLPGGAHSSRASSRRPALRLETRAMSTPHKYPMISMREAMDIALSRASPLPEERVGFDDAVGRVLSSDVVAPRPHPPFPASIMDGYAVRASDCPAALAVVAAARGRAHRHRGRTRPGDLHHHRRAPPRGADAVVQVERVSVVGDVARVSNPVPVGANVRPLGSDVAEGETILPAGTLVGPHEIGVAALAGVRLVPVRRKPRVAVLSTGDELADPRDESSSITFGRIFDANRPMLLAAAARRERDDGSGRR